MLRKSVKCIINSRLLRFTLSALFILCAVYIVVNHWHIVSHGVYIAKHAVIWWVILALLLLVTTYALAAGVYSILALHKLRYAETLLIEMSSAFINRLLPSGIGSLGLHGDYLYHRKHSVTEATVIVSINNLLGVTAHVFLLVIILVINPNAFQRFIHHEHIHIASSTVLVLILGLSILILLGSKKLKSLRIHIVSSLRKERSSSLLRAFIIAILVTSTYTAILFCCAQSLRMSISIIQVFIIFSIGIFTSTIVPIPGGLIGAEAGLFAGFIGYGFSSTVSTAAVLLYRLITYWLPIVPGVLALAFARRQKLL